MRVVIDARWVNPTPSGVGVYTTELVRRLPRLAPEWGFHLLFCDEALRARLLEETGLAGAENVTSEVLSYGVFAPEGQLLLPRRLRAAGARLYHSTNYMMPYLAFPRGGRDGGCGRAVVTIHDVIPLLLADHAPRSRKSRMLGLFRFCLVQAARRAAAVITVSEASRRDLLSALRVDDATAARVTAVHNGVHSRFRPRQATGAAERAAARVRTVLYVGRYDPYKNVVELVRAFGIVHRALGGSVHLLVVGPEDARYPEARQTADALGLRHAVTFLGYLSDADLVTAYQEASLLVNPSRYEGFGLQLLEAMRCGVPVVCTDGGAQPEVVGSAGLVVPAGDAHALAEAMLGVLRDDALRRRLVAGGLERSAAFTWEATAAATLAVYRRAAGGGP